jgi:repressor LexA
MLYINEMSLGKNIAARRTQLEFTQEDLAEACGVSSQAVSQWERGENDPEVDKIPLIAKKLQMPLSWPFDAPGAFTDARLLAIWAKMTPDKQKQALAILEALEAA